MMMIIIHGEKNVKQVGFNKFWLRNFQRCISLRSFRETRSASNNKQTCKLKSHWEKCSPLISLFFYYRFPSSSSWAWLYLKFKFVIKLNQKKLNPYGEFCVCVVWHKTTFEYNFRYFLMIFFLWMNFFLSLVLIRIYGLNLRHCLIEFWGTCDDDDVGFIKYKSMIYCAAFW